MSARVYDCKICGWKGLQYPHQGSVDCISQYRLLVDDLQRLLPQGKEVMRTCIARDSTARLWIDGELSHESLSRLITFIEFMREAWTPKETQPANTAVEVGLQEN